MTPGCQQATLNGPRQEELRNPPEVAGGLRPSTARRARVSSGGFGGAAKALITGGAGFIGSHLCRAAARSWRGGLGPRRPLARAHSQRRADSRDRPDFHLVVDSVPEPRRRQRARPQVRRRLPPRRRRRRAPDRRAARAHDGHEPRRARRSCSSTATGSASACSSRRARRSTATTARRRRSRRTTGASTGRHGAPLAVRGLEGDGRVPRARLPPGARARLRHRPPLQHRRAAPVAGSTEWSSRASSSALSPASRSRSTATARRRARSATCRTRSAPSTG